MQTVHKKNLIMVYAGIALLSITSILSYGLNLNVLNAEVCLVGAGIIATIAYFVVKNDMVKALAIVLAPPWQPSYMHCPMVVTGLLSWRTS